MTIDLDDRFTISMTGFPGGWAYVAYDKNTGQEDRRSGFQSQTEALLQAMAFVRDCLSS